MYQDPVGGLEKIRKTRTKVKHILSDIGLEDCQSFLEELQNSDPGDDDIFVETEWTDFTEGFNGRRKKKWIYRTETICCRLCEYQTQHWRNFKYHLQRNHDCEAERNMCALSPCPLCPFVGHPKIVRRHIWLFHSNSQPPVAPAGAMTEGLIVAPKKGLMVTPKKVERYRCRECSFRSSVLFAMKKHVLLAHLGSMLSRFSLRNPDLVHPHTHRYHCKECALSLQNLDVMLHHVLVTPAHQSVNWHVRPFIIENRQAKAAKTQPPPVLSGGLLLPPANGQQAATALQQPGNATGMHGAPNSGSFMCAPPGTNQSLLPAQASALVQLASAEAKGLLKPGTTITFQSTLPPAATMPLTGSGGPALVRIATPSNLASKPALMAAGALGQHPLQPWPQQVLLPNLNMPRPGAVGPPHPPTPTPKLPLNQTTPQGTMLTSKSLFSHLIPTGKRIDGKPTYTLAPLDMTTPLGKETAQSAAGGRPRTNFAPRAKRWVACPVCNELFPSDVYEAHTEVVHKSATSKHECLAAKTPFLRKMPDKTVKCVICKVLVSEKGLLEHLLHGLDCIFCASKFNSIRKLVEHSKEHNPSRKAYSEFLRREYRLYTNDSGQLMFPYFDINTTAPKEMLGDSEIDLALVTKSLDLIFLKMLPSSRHAAAACSTSAAKTVRTCCLFCDENCQTPENYQQHLRQKHFVDATENSVLKTAAFKCIYCNGVYAGGRVTQRGIAFHLRNCQCAPKAPANAEKAPTGADKPLTNGQVALPVAPGNRQPMLLPTPVKGQTLLIPAPKLQIRAQAPMFYFAQLPQAPVPSLPKPAVPSLPKPAPPTPEPPQSEAEKLSKLRLEMAWKKAMEANRQEREERAAKRLRQEQEKAAPPPPAAASQPDVPIDRTVKLALDPRGLEQQPTEQRKDFLTRYFHTCPYLTKKESDELSNRLVLTKSEVAMLFSNKRTKCMRTMNKKKAEVLLGFNMAELNKVKHNLHIPEVAPEETEEPVQSEVEDKSGESGNAENREGSEKTNCQKPGQAKDKLEGVEAEMMDF